MDDHGAFSVRREPTPAPDPGEAPRVVTRVVPCAARPSTGFVHRDGACRCFVGGPAPEFTPPVLQRSFAAVAS